MLIAERAHVVRAVLAAHRVAVLCWWLGGIAVLTLIVPLEPQQVPLRDGVTTEPWPLLLALSAAGVSAALSPPGPELSEALPRPAWMTRLSVLAAVAAATAGTVVVTCLAIDRPVDMALRNASVCLAAALLVASVIGASLAWIPPVAIVAVTWLYGKDERGVPRDWNVLSGGTTTGQVVLALAAVSLAALLWVGRGSRLDRDQVGGGTR